MLADGFSLNTIYMIVGFLLSMFSCVSNDIIQTLGTFLSANKNTKSIYIWLFTSAVLILTIGLGWYFNNGDLSFGRLDRIPVAESFSIIHVLPPIILLVLTRYGIPVATAFLILSIFSVSNAQVIGLMLTKSFIGYGTALICSIIIYSIIARPIERYFYYTQKKQGTQISKWWMVAKWCSTAFLWSQWIMQDAAILFVFLPRKASVGELVFVLTACTLFLAYVAYNRGGEIQNIVKMKTNVQDPRSATIIDLIYASLLLYFVTLNNIPMSTTWVFLGLLAGREIALYHRLRFESPKKMYKHVFKDLAKVTFGMIISLLVVVILTQFHIVKDFFIMHFMG